VHGGRSGHDEAVCKNGNLRRAIAKTCLTEWSLKTAKSFLVNVALRKSTVSFSLGRSHRQSKTPAWVELDGKVIKRWRLGLA
jgi:hypothetical protein